MITGYVCVESIIFYRDMYLGRIDTGFEIISPENDFTKHHRLGVFNRS